MPLTWKRYGALNDNGDAFRRVDAYEGYKSDLQSGMKESEAYARARDYLSNWGVKGTRIKPTYNERLYVNMNNRMLEGGGRASTGHSGD